MNRWQFLLESMQDLSDSLHQLNEKQRLRVLRGAPEEVLPLVWKDWGITHMVFEKVSPGVWAQAELICGLGYSCVWLVVGLVKS